MCKASQRLAQPSASFNADPSGPLCLALSGYQKPMYSPAGLASVVGVRAAVLTIIAIPECWVLPLRWGEAFRSNRPRSSQDPASKGFIDLVAIPSYELHVRVWSIILVPF